MSTIHGFWSAHQVFVDGTRLSPRESQNRINHSPDGFNWGYGGSGPAQLALALLLHFYGEVLAREHYQDFKWDVIAKLPQGDFNLESETIAAWMLERRKAQS